LSEKNLSLLKCITYEENLENYYNISTICILSDNKLAIGKEDGSIEIRK